MSQQAVVQLPVGPVWVVGRMGQAAKPALNRGGQSLSDAAVQHQRVCRTILMALGLWKIV